MNTKDQFVVLIGIVLSALLGIAGVSGLIYAGYLLAEWIRL